MALDQNPHVTVMKLCYNNLGDEGVAVLASGIADHPSLESLDLGFNNVGDDGCRALARAIPVDDGRVWTIHMAGNLIGEDGAMTLADLIRKRCCVRKLYLSGNRLGPSGVRALAMAIVEDEASRASDVVQDGRITDSDGGSTANGGSNGSVDFVGVQELFLGGTHMGPTGCGAVAQLLGRTRYLKTLSLSNCELTDDLVEILASHIKSNREHLPLEALHLSFNRMTYRGMEHLSNAIWGSTTVKELLLDNNEIGDTGAQCLAAVLPVLRRLETLNVGFNRIKSPGMKLLMKAVSESPTLKSLSVSGNPVDTTSAKFIAYALAYNFSLVSVSLDHCSINTEGQRHIVAGIVSNSQINLREVRGFSIGPVIVTLGFPVAMEHWNNEHVMNFIHLMWERSSVDRTSAEEKVIDPLHFLPSDGPGPSLTRVAPLDAAVVVDYAKKAYDSLVQEGFDVFSRRPGHSDQQMIPPPSTNGTYPGSSGSHEDEDGDSILEPLSASQNQSFVAAPEEVAKPNVPDPSRKKRIVEWLCSNIQYLNKLSQKPFSSAELWKLHQHYFTPVVNESGGNASPSPDESEDTIAPLVSSVPEVSRGDSSSNHGASVGESLDDPDPVSTVDPFAKSSVNGTNGLTSFPLLKRKVSYRFLGDAALSSTPNLDVRRAPSANGNGALSVSMMIEGGPTGNTLPPRTKRARRNRTRISFLPRVKAKLDSLLDVCHEKALVTMRQLYFVEQAILRGEVNPIDPKTTSRTHLCGDFATDAQIIVCDMI
jgi:Ran GTPase-activating protein (RanGAP) involved in mRNA processing and transport